MIKIGPIEMTVAPPLISFDGEDVYHIPAKKAAEILFYIEKKEKKELRIVKDLVIATDPEEILEIRVGCEKINLDFGERLLFKRYLEFIRDLPFLSALKRTNIKPFLVLG